MPPNTEHIRVRAYFLWLDRDPGASDDPLRYWVEAEKEQVGIEFAMGNQMPSITLPAAQELPGEVAHLLVLLASDWTPTLTGLGSPLSFKIKGNDVAPWASEVVIENGRLRIQWGGQVTPDEAVGPGTAESGATLQALRASPELDSPIEGELPGGRRFRIDPPFSPKNNTNWTPESATFEHLVSGARWLVESERHARFWVAPIIGCFSSRARNLRIIKENGAKFDNLRLRGRFDYYILGSGNDALLVIDTGDREFPRRGDLLPDFLTLQFVSGQVLRLEVFYGVSADGDVVAAHGETYGRLDPEAAGEASPLPNSGPFGTWEAPLFSSISRKYRTSPELKLYVPLELYLDALVEHVDGAYLKLQVALEAVAERYLKLLNDKVPVVRDIDVWKAWVRDHKAEINALAPEDERDQRLFGMVSKLPEHATSGYVKRVFELFGVKLSKEIKAELGGRNVIVHTALMSEDDANRDFASDVRRVAVVRTLLVMMLAKIAGYNGPIASWDASSDTLELEGMTTDAETRDAAVENFRAVYSPAYRAHAASAVENGDPALEIKT